MALPKGTTTTEVLTVNGVILNTLAKNIESLTGRLRTPAKRTANVVVPGRHGAVRTTGKKYDQNVLALPMWVIGADDDGSIPRGSSDRKEFFARVDELVTLFSGNGDVPLDIRHTLPDGSVRQCFGDVLDVINFTTQDGESPLAKVGVSIQVPGAFWQDLNEVTDTVVANGASVTLPHFAGASAPMEDCRVQLVGPWNNPVLTFSDGSWVKYSDSLTAGKGVLIDASNWTLSGVGGYTPSLSKLTYSGSSSHWFCIPPTGEATPTVQIVGGASERTAATSMTMTGRRKYLVG
jgi:hypothetical protein